MALDPQLLEILACPEDKGPLLYFEGEGALYNPRLKRRYTVRDDIPIMLVDEAETVDRRRARAADGQGRGRGHPPDLRGVSRQPGSVRPGDRAEASDADGPTDDRDSLGFLDAVAGLPEQLAAAHEAARRDRPVGASRPPTTSATSSCSAWAGPASPVTCSPPSPTARCRCRSPCSSSTAPLRSSDRTRSCSRSRTRATPRRRCR